MPMDFDILSLWFLKPWLPFGLMLLALLVFSLAMSYVWLTRPSGRSGSTPPNARRRWFLSAALFVPTTVALGFSSTIFPVAPPEVLFLRSQAIGAGTNPVESECLESVTEAIRLDTPLQLGCLAAYLHGTDGEPLSQKAVGAAGPPLPSVSRVELLSNVEASKKKVEQALEVAAQRALNAEGRSTASAALAASFQRRISALAHWWAAAGVSRSIDAAPVVERALQGFDWGRFDEEDYRRASPSLVGALQEAVELALAQVSPRVLSPGELPAAPNPRPRQRPGVIQEIEAAVVRLLVARRNVRAAVIEYHPRREERPEARTWNRLAASFAEGADTATGKAVAVALIPGSTRSPGSLVRILGEPWKSHSNPTGQFKAFAQLSFGATLSERWSLSLEAETGGDKKLVRFICGNLSQPRERQFLTDCFPNWSSLGAGSSAVLELDVFPAPPIEPETSLTLTITFPDHMGFQPLAVPFPKEDESSHVAVAIADRSEYFQELDSTLSCLLEPGARVADQPSIQWLKLAIGEGGRAQIVKNQGGAVVRYDTTTQGIWIYPADLNWDWIREYVLPKLIVERAVPFAHLMDEPSEELHGAALFPVAVAAPEMPDGFGARTPFPLRPRRLSGSPLAAGIDPATGLGLPTTARLLMPEAVPVAFSMIPAHFSVGAVAAHERSVAPLAWRVDLPDSSDGSTRGGRIWYFSVNPEYQGLLLPNDCQTDRGQVAALLCYGSIKEVQSYEPVYEEKRFFTFWLWFLRAARASAIAWKDDTPPLKEQPIPPMFVSPAMVSRARIASASGGMLLVGTGLLLHGIFVVWLRVRGYRHSMDA